MSVSPCPDRVPTVFRTRVRNRVPVSLPLQGDTGTDALGRPPDGANRVPDLGGPREDLTTAAGTSHDEAAPELDHRLTAAAAFQAPLTPTAPTMRAPARRRSPRLRATCSPSWWLPLVTAA